MPPPPAPAPVAKAAPRVTSTMAAPVSAKTAAASSAEVKALRAEVSALKERVEVLENENVQLRAENDNMRRNGVVVAGAAPAAAVAVAAPPPSSPGDAPYTSTPSRRGSDAKDLLRKRLSVHGGAAASAAKAATDEANDLDMTSEHPDWDKKYSDQHKRVYWRHKV
jgi:hypothetical protein